MKESTFIVIFNLIIGMIIGHLLWVAYARNPYNLNHDGQVTQEDADALAEYVDKVAYSGAPTSSAHVEQPLKPIEFDLEFSHATTTRELTETYYCRGVGWIHQGKDFAVYASLFGEPNLSLPICREGLKVKECVSESLVVDKCEGIIRKVAEDCQGGYTSSSIRSCVIGWSYEVSTTTREKEKKDPLPNPHINQ